MKLFPGIAGLAAVLLFILAVQSCGRPNTQPALSDYGKTALPGLRDSQLAIQRDMLTLSAMRMTDTSAGIRLNALATSAAVIGAQIDGWKTGKLKYAENFDGKWINAPETVFGRFDVYTENGNSVWRTARHSVSTIELPPQSGLYTVRFRIMQADGSNGFGGVFLGNDNIHCPAYELWVNPASDLIALIEKDTACLVTKYIPYTREVLSTGIWYTILLEVKPDAINVYLNDNPAPILQDDNRASEPPRIDTLGVRACCDDTVPYSFDFDNVEVWIP